jgi:hypothetical protein
VNYAVRRGKWDENEKEKTNRKLENKKQSIWRELCRIIHE